MNGILNHIERENRRQLLAQLGVNRQADREYIAGLPGDKFIMAVWMIGNKGQS